MYAPSLYIFIFQREGEGVVFFLLLMMLPLVCNAAENNRLTSRPYIAGDSFRTIADHIFDDWTVNLDPTNPNYPPCVDATADLNPEAIKSGDIIFTRLVNFEHFVKNIAPRIKVKYIVVSHNQVHDHSSPGKYKDFLESENLIAWFGQNCDLPYEHPKFVPIPIGLSNKHWDHSREHSTWLARFKTASPVDRTTLLYVNVNVTTNPRVRVPVVDYFKTLSFCTVIPSWKPYPQFLKDLAQSKFVLSPHGNGLDCHRTWEALYMGCIPVVKTSTLDPVYKDLPVLIVEKWEDITREFLEEQYKRLKQGTYCYEKLYFDYWETLIREYQKPYKS